MARTITARKARDKRAAQLLRQRRATHSAQKRIARNGEATLKTHAIAAGLTARQARSVSARLRSHAHDRGINGREVETRVKWRTNSRKTGLVTAHLYTPAEVAEIALGYRPRKDAYRSARTYLLAA